MNTKRWDSSNNENNEKEKEELNRMLERAYESVTFSAAVINVDWAMKCF